MDDRVGLTIARPKLFIVFGNQRTGSTLVASRLNSHPNIVCYEEVLLPWVNSSPCLRDWLTARNRPQWLRAVPGVRKSFLDDLMIVQSPRDLAGAIGFKLMYNQASLWPKIAYLAPQAGTVFKDHALQQWIIANKVIILHTRRRNRLKALVSHQLAAQSGRFHSREPDVSCRSVVISVRGLKARLGRIEAAERVACRAIRGLPAVDIFYEDYASLAREETDSQLCAALGQVLPEGGLSTPLSKIASDDLRVTVKNYDQVATVLSGTRFERFLM